MRAPKWWRLMRRRIRLRTRRQYLLGRAIRRSGRLNPVMDRTDQIRPDSLLAFVALRNEAVRLPYFLDYYRAMGITHFLIVDNDSDDGSREYLLAQDDVSLWTTSAGYKASRFGMDWLSYLLFRYGPDHWCLTVDPDEFLVFPHDDTRPLRALTDWMDASGMRALPAMLLDMYPRGGVTERRYIAGEDPFGILRWFDAANYAIRLDNEHGNLWIQGGPRARMFFPNAPERAPSLNKIPLVKWERSYVYVSSTHMLLPRAVNLVYDRNGGERISGILLHAKFLSTFAEKAVEELDRRQHYNNSVEYKAYHSVISRDHDMWTEESVAYEDWRQLERLGLISRGHWI